MVPTVASINVNVSGTGAELDFDEEKYANSNEYRESCRDAGYEDGQNGPFNHDNMMNVEDSIMHS